MDFNSNTWVLVIHVILSLVIGENIGKKKKIGSGWSIFFCLTLTIILGLIITMFSKKIDAKPKSEYPFIVMVGIILVGLIGLAGIFFAIQELTEVKEVYLIGPNETTSNNDSYFMLFFSIGLIGLSIYGIKQ